MGTRCSARLSGILLVILASPAIADTGIEFIPAGECFDVWVPADTGGQAVVFVAPGHLAWFEGRSLKKRPFSEGTSDLLKNGVVRSGGLASSMTYCGWVQCAESPSAVLLVPRPGGPADAGGGGVTPTRVDLPGDAAYFAFIRARGKGVSLIVVTEDGIRAGEIEESGDISFEDVTGFGPETDYGFAHAGVARELDSVMDVDGDGLSDLLLPRGNVFDIFLQDESGIFTRTSNVETEERTTPRYVYSSEYSALPILSVVYRELWLEPTLGEFPDLAVITPGGKPILYNQVRRGVFELGKALNIPRRILHRYVSTGRIYPGYGVGVFTAQVVSPDRMRLDVILEWKDGAGHEIQHRMRNNPILPWIVDLNSDGVFEIVAWEMPDITKAIESLLNNASFETDLIGTVLAWSPEASSFKQISNRFTWRTGAWGSDVQDAMERVDRGVIIGHDPNGDGCGDLAWIEGDDIEIVFLEERRSGFWGGKPVKVPIPGGRGTSLRSADVNRDNVSDIIVSQQAGDEPLPWGWDPERVLCPRTVIFIGRER